MSRAIRGPVRSSSDDRRAIRIATYAWGLVILVATSIPGSKVPFDLPRWEWADKVAHFTMYGVLGVLTGAAFLAGPIVQDEGSARARTRGRTHTIWLVLALLAIFAGADELHQHWIRGRMPSPGDWFADVLGVGAGIAIGIRFRRPNRQNGSGIDRETDS